MQRSKEQEEEGESENGDRMAWFLISRTLSGQAGTAIAQTPCSPQHISRAVQCRNCFPELQMRQFTVDDDRAPATTNAIRAK